MNIKLIIFDLSGIMLNDEQCIFSALQKAFAKEGITLNNNEPYKVMGLPTLVVIKQILRSLEIEYSLVQDAYKIYKSFIDEIAQSFQNNEVLCEKKGVSDTFRILKENGIKVAVSTDYSRIATEELIGKLGWRKNQLLDAVITTDDVESKSPSPEIIFKTMEMLGIDEVEEVAKVGGTPYGLIQGTAAGCELVIGIASSSFSEEELGSAYHRNIINEISEVLDFLGISNKILV